MSVLEVIMIFFFFAVLFGVPALPFVGLILSAVRLAQLKKIPAEDTEKIALKKKQLKRAVILTGISAAVLIAAAAVLIWLDSMGRLFTM